MPFGAKCEFENMQACVAANGDKEDPESYCATLMRQTEEACMSKSQSAFRTKLVRAETKVIEKGRVQAVVSTEAKDRDGDIIRQENWNLSNFMAHPVLLSSHDYMSLRSQIGEWEDMAVKGKRLVGVAKYYIGEGNEEADWGYNLAEKGRAAYSVGFIPDMAKAVSLDENDKYFGGMEFRGQELLEVSHVTIPSNPQALQGIKAIKLHPAVAEIVDEVLKEQNTGASIKFGTGTVSSSLMLTDNSLTIVQPPVIRDTEAELVERIVQRLKAEVPEIFKAMQPPVNHEGRKSIDSRIRELICEEVINK